MKALIIVDVQNDFLPGGALAVAEGDLVVPVINQLSREFDLVFTTQDWHPANHCSFAASHPGKKIGDRILVGGQEQVLWPVHCVQNSFGAELAAGLNPQVISGGVHISKGTDERVDSYSGFFENQRKRATGLNELLRQHGADDLTIVGLATDYCVKATVLDALELGFAVTVLTKACRAVNLSSDDGAKALAAMRTAGAKVV
ncbi:MAG: bifunctional nicotinamidase/pyrazinamidase [Verrucomicrobia bacterium]|nr:bifunctional nicotinamidase/pyrazinamidase [Verrucomicrobiota bacterium]